MKYNGIDADKTSFLERLLLLQTAASVVYGLFGLEGLYLFYRVRGPVFSLVITVFEKPTTFLKFDFSWLGFDAGDISSFFAVFVI